MTVEERNRQRLEALARANEVRKHRAAVKAAVAQAQRDADEVLVCGDPKLATMRLDDLLLAVPGLGRHRLRRMLVRERISPSTTLAKLTARQRGYLLTALRSHRKGSTIYGRKREANARV